MHTFVLQDWITISGKNGTGAGGSIVQSASDWLDLAPFQDLFAWVAVSEITTGSGGRVDLYLETAPSDDESLFQSMTGAAVPAIQGLAASSTPTVVKLPMLTAAVPLSRLLRWRLANGSASNTWDVTMRIVVAANSPGM